MVRLIMKPEVVIEPRRTSMMSSFLLENINKTIFAKSFIVDVPQGSEYASVKKFNVLM